MTELFLEYYCFAEFVQRIFKSCDTRTPVLLQMKVMVWYSGNALINWALSYVGTVS